MITLSISEMTELIADRTVWKGGLVPLACDIDDDYLCLDLGEGGSVFEFSEEEGRGDKPVASSLAVYLEKLRDALLSNRLEWCDGVGLVEVLSL